MSFRLFVLALCLPLLLVSQNKKPSKAQPIIEIVEMAVRREGDRVNIDGRLKNSGERAVKKLRIFIEFRDPDGKVISTRTGGIEQEVLGPDGEAELHAAVPDAVRAVDIKFRYEDNAGRELDTVNAGPFTIE